MRPNSNFRRERSGRKARMPAASPSHRLTSARPGRASTSARRNAGRWNGPDWGSRERNSSHDEAGGASSRTHRTSDPPVVIRPGPPRGGRSSGQAEIHGHRVVPVAGVEPDFGYGVSAREGDLHRFDPAP